MTAAANHTTDAMAELTAMTIIAKALQSLDAESVRRFAVGGESIWKSRKTHTEDHNAS